MNKPDTKTRNIPFFRK